MLGQYKCQALDHIDKEIYGICENVNCKMPFRRVCFACIKDHQEQDQNFNMQDIKMEQDLQIIIDEFKVNNIDRITNINLQCQIQQYMLNIEMMEYVKMQNNKYNKINEILSKLQLFKDNEWEQISIDHYLANENKNLSIPNYLSQFQQKLLQIDDLKDNYLQNIFDEQQNKELNELTEWNKLPLEVFQTINKYQMELVKSIQQSYLFQRKNTQDDPFVITLFELLLEEGCKLNTDVLYEQFQAYQDIVMKNQEQVVDDYQSLYIQSYAISCKCQKDEKLRDIGLGLIEQSIILQPQNPKSYKIKGDLYEEAGRYEEAILMYDKSLELDPQNCTAFNNKGSALDCMKQYQEAIQMFDMAIKLDPRNSNAYNNKGSSLDSLEQYEEAIQMFDLAIKLDPKNSSAYNNKGFQLDSQQNYEEAIKMFDQAIRLNPKNSSTYNYKGSSLDSLQKYEEAIKMFDQAINLDPKNSNAYKNKGFTLYNMQKYEEAIQMYDQAIQIDPQNSFVYYNKGSSLSSLQKYEEAIQMFDLAIQLDPTNQYAYYTKAYSQYMTKQFQQSKANFELYLTMVPEDEDAQNYLQKCDIEIKEQQN